MVVDIIFSYDKMSRLLGAEHFEGTSNTNKFTEKAIAYDKNSNITSMTRYVSGTPSTMTFAYTGNRRNGFNYDANGNITADATNNIQVSSYNLLNLPTTIKQNNAVKATYTYLADGTKTKTVNASNGGFDYVGSFRYTRNGSNISLESVASAGGRTYQTSGGYETRYFVADHLGSTRIIASSNGTVLEQNDYMPYGERHTNATHATLGNPYLFNGKELQKNFGINYIDSEARFQRLDGAFNSIDPLCEKYYHVSPYSYCAANPVNLVDPDGKEIFISFINGTLKIRYIGKLYNDSKSNYTRDQMEVFASQFKHDIESTWTGQVGDINVETTVDLKVAQSMEDIEESDHVIYIGEDYEMNKYDVLGADSSASKTANGKGSIGGKYMAINNMLLNNPTGAELDGGRTVAHEFGHNLGLKHPAKADNTNPSYIGNIMWQHHHKLAGKSLSPIQLNIIISNGQNGKINLHSNKYPRY